MMETVENMVVMRFPSKAANIGFARTAVALFASQLEFTLMNSMRLRSQYRRQYPML